MAGWISSKLKVAEHLLQQIDQQAAETLGQGECNPLDELDIARSPKLSTSVSLKDQLKKKDSPKSNEDFDKLGSKIASRKIRNDHASKQKLDSHSTVNNSDWTEFLKTPDKPIVHSSGRALTRGVRRGGGNVGLIGKGDGTHLGRGKKQGIGNGGMTKADVGTRKSDAQESSNSCSTSGVQGLEDGDKEMGRSEPVKDFSNVTSPVGKIGRDDDNDDVVKRGNVLLMDNSQFVGNNPDASIGISDNVSAQALTNDKEGDFPNEYMGKSTLAASNINEHVANYALRARAHVSDSDSDSDSGSSSSSNSEVERKKVERIQRRRQILAAKAAAKVSEAIKEQENLVARLEGEKQSLDKILEERAKQAELEACKLQSTMIETMEAADIEKRKHNNTRMEILARLAKVETANANLAKSLASAQWNLETEVNNVAELWRLIDVKKHVHEELKRRIYDTHRTRTSLTCLVPCKGVKLEREMLEGEYSLLKEKIGLLQVKAIKLEGDIEMILKEMESPTEIEVELKRRLCQMTDHLIQKQAQVEALSSEKATLLFRIEVVSKTIDENKSLSNEVFSSGSSREDLGRNYESTGPKLHMFQYKIQSGKQHLGSLVRQLDVVFYAGAQLLARNPAAKLWSLVYLICLHFWVLYILLSHSQSAEHSTSSSIISLENINKSIGV